MKRLYKNSENKMISGVCQGLSEYFNLDVTIIRLIWVIVTLCSAGLGIIGYLIAAVIMPDKFSSQ